MAHIIRAFHPFWAHLGKVANATFVNPRNWQKWTCVDLVDQITSPRWTTWCGGLIWSCDHSHKSWNQGEKVGNVELFKFGSGQKGFWGTLINITCSPTCAIWSRWIIRTFEHVWQCKVVQTSKWTEMVLRGFDDVILFSKRWDFARSSNMSYVTL